MTLRFLSSTTISDGRPSARRAVAAAVLVLAGATVAHAAPDAASAAAGDPAAPLTITVRPGQSLNDIAVAVTQSHDPAVLARVGRALFDANPQAFMKRDPSRLKIGAQLAVPTLDATGAAAGAAASGAAASGAASAAGAASHAVASAATAAASHPAATSMSTASHAAAALAASAAAGTASSANGASAPGAASTHAPSAAAQAAAPAASSSVGGPHVWSGSIQQAPAAASGASAAGAEALLVPGAANLALSGSSAQVATGASQARPSSLQQLLALKNRVLMELQKHGIGKPAANGALTPAPVAGSAQKPQPSAAASAVPRSGEGGSEAAATAGSTTSAASAPAVTPPVSTAPRTAVPQLSFNSGAAIAVGAAVVALIAGFALRRRKKGPPADAIEPGAFTPAPALDPDAVAAIAGAPDAAAEEKREAGGQAATAAAHRESPIAPPAEVKTAPTKTESTIAESKSAPATGPDIAATRGPQTPPVEPLTLEMPQPDERSGAPHTPESDDAQSGVPQTGAKTAPYAWRQAFPHDAITALDSLDMPLPPRASISDDAGQVAESQHAEPAGSGSAQSATNGQAATHRPIGAEDSREVGTHGEATPGADHDGGESLRDETPVARPWGAEPHQATPLGGAEQGEAAAPVAGSPAIESQSEGQRRQDASGAESQAFAAGAGGSGAGALSQPAALGAAQPLTSNEATPHADEPPQTAPQQAGDASPQAAAPHEASTPGFALPNALPGHAETPLAAPQPGASFAAPSPAAPSREPAASSPNLPPLGVAQFGALSLDFDLDLPTGPSASLPVFTPEALAKIARNKLELASEYVELGDLAGARTLLHEVIEAGHADTRDEAHVMLAKLADLS
ncbi:hypothetical protein WS70_25935 [Burkholderia mayonis]|uniref:Pilus assembly protein FimV n=1 Tax=Burkholderia mayonis TaxID=1385591 RepID=A0A1B4FNB0_9BURK|nr:FimV/HubP family polar landmark protein [Burkholderia mayonis]AOJ05156.1 hypothetical protein WS70_25935 [Burkholderia mayonis]KVE44957.1 hypothetical protein WS70_06350 [Burkholderia mayonis]